MKKRIILICIVLSVLLIILGIAYDKNKKLNIYGKDIDSSNYNTYSISKYKEDSHYTYDDDENLKSVTFSLPETVYLTEINENGITYGDNNLFIKTIDDNPENIDEYIKDFYESTKEDYSDYYITEVRSTKNAGYLVKQIQDNNYSEQLYVFVKIGNCYSIINYRLVDNKFDQTSIDYLISHAKERSISDIDLCDNNKCKFDLSSIEIKEKKISIETPENSIYEYTSSHHKYNIYFYSNKNSNQISLNVYYGRDIVISEENGNAFIPSDYEKTEVNINNKTFSKLKYTYDDYESTFYGYYYRVNDNLLYKSNNNR